MSTFVLVHGAWHGGWSWDPVRHILEKAGHRVYTPTMTGLGERAHLLSDGITMDTVVEDISNVIRFKNLNDVILVGHSFGGAVISGVAEQVPQQISKLIYFDAAVLENGESMFCQMHPTLVRERQLLAEETSNGLSLPTPSAEDLGISDQEQWEFVKQFLTPHPLSSYDTPLHLKKQPGEGFDCVYIVCTNPKYGPLEWARERVTNYGWPVIPINTGHNAMVSAPQELSDIFMQFC